jgi:hypothetical protein
MIGQGDGSDLLERRLWILEVEEVEVGMSLTNYEKEDNNWKGTPDTELLFILGGGFRMLL